MILRITSYNVCYTKLLRFRKQILPRDNQQYFVPLDEKFFYHNYGSELVQAENLSFTYLQNTPLTYQALEDVSFKIRNGSVHGLIGATGSGKSTLLQHLNGLYLPQSGHLKVGPFDVV